MAGVGGSLQVASREVEVVAVGVVPDLLTVEEAARVLRIGRATAYKDARLYLATGGKKGLPVIVVGGVLRVPRVLLEAMIGGPIREIPPRPVRVKVEPAGVVDLRDRRNPTRKRTRGTKAESSTQLPIDIG